MGRDEFTGKQFWYPRDPSKDTVHRRLCYEHGHPEPGYRYGYDEKGHAISFHVSSRAYDWVPPPPGCRDIYTDDNIRPRRNSLRRVPGRDRRNSHAHDYEPQSRRKSTYARDESELRSRRKSTYARDEGQYDSRRGSRKHGESRPRRDSRRARFEQELYESNKKFDLEYYNEHYARDEPRLPDEYEEPPSDEDSEVKPTRKLIEWDVDRLSEGIKRL